MTRLGNFLKDHNISGKTDLSLVEKSLVCVSAAQDIFDDLIRDGQQVKSNIVQLTHLNLVGRIFEQVEGMLVCIVANSPTSAEALARVVIEGSVNLMYLAKKGDEYTIHDFFKAWTVEHKRKLSHWKDVANEEDVELMFQIEEREKLVDRLDGWVNRFKGEIEEKGMTQAVCWPGQLLERFKQVDLVQDYYSCYHRLSGSSHFTSEDTILWVLSVLYLKNGNRELSEEAWSYSIMMARYACMYFIGAIQACCECHGLSDKSQVEQLESLRRKALAFAEELKEKAGVPRQVS